MDNQHHPLAHILGTIITFFAALPPWVSDLTDSLKVLSAIVALLVGGVTIWSIFRDQRRKDRQEVRDSTPPTGTKL